MDYALIQLIVLAENLITFLVIISVILSYFMDPYHPVRAAVDRLVNPMLRPIRRVVPLVGMLDLSPIILIILVQLIARILIGMISSLFN